MKHMNNTINYIEFPLIDPVKTKAFYTKVFGWTFTDWGEDYIEFLGAGISGGFNMQDHAPVTKPGVLIVLYAQNLDQAACDVEAAGGKIIKSAYAFPGGRRFHFTDPNGIELAIWSET